MMTNMTSMKLDPKGEDAMETALVDKREYPYGLEISLSSEDLAKLGQGMPAVGAELMLHACVKVTRTSSYQEADGEAEGSVSLQITDMALAPKAAETKTADALYGA
jgi:hypothetical protein